LISLRGNKAPTLSPKKETKKQRNVLIFLGFFATADGIYCDKWGFVAYHYFLMHWFQNVVMFFWKPLDDALRSQKHAQTCSNKPIHVAVHISFIYISADYSDPRRFRILFFIRRNHAFSYHPDTGTGVWTCMIVIKLRLEIFFASGV
jgi:hypothetical protein